MLLNYLKIAIRSLLKFKGYTFINLFGLALGLTAGIMILLYVMDELSYDKFHSKADRLYRIETKFVSLKPGATDDENSEANAWPIGNILKKEYPEVEEVLYTRGASWLLISHEGKKIRQNNFFSTPEFFRMFSFPLLKGNPEKALVEPYSIVITEDMEKKYFNGDGLNKSLMISDTIQFLVTGVLKNIPSNSHIQFDMLLSFSTYQRLEPGFNVDDGWGNINMRNYVLLKEGADEKAFAAKAKNIYMDRVGEQMKNWGVSAYVVFTPLKDLYLTTTKNGFGPVGSIDRVYLVAGIAAFVILLACINFINLTTARSVYRAKEVGLRKVVGSTRTGLIRQFLSESFVLTTIALVIAFALIGVLLPLFNQLLAKTYSLQSLLAPTVIIGILVLILVVTFLSGYYPSLVMSGMKPAEVLKGRMQTGAKGVQLRRSLVVFQFVISIGLVLGTLIVLDQLNYMQQQDLGFAKEEIFVINAARTSSPNPDAFQTFKNEIKTLAIVEDVAYSNSLPGHQGWNNQVAYPEGRSGTEAVSVEYMAIDEHYIKTLGLELVAGRGFDPQHERELKDGLVLNETAVAMFGWTSPQEAIGKKITSPSGYPAGEVIGVVKDYHQLGLQQHIGPMAMDYNPRQSFMYAIRYKASDTQQLISSLGKLWQKHFPGYDFNYFFLDEDFEKQYQSEQRLAKVFALFAGITIVIAMIGLLGLVSFMVVSRTKEIGVRKVLGANVLHITSLLSGEFMLLVLIANIIACPLAWYISEAWLQRFANRVDVNPVLFLITLLIAVAVTLITISFQTVKAAIADPVKSLRYE